jgi:2-polyprenyl-3-methyl-5-hydroxy-6-metoxy-1,4-benzoquinol methylase
MSAVSIIEILLQDLASSTWRGITMRLGPRFRYDGQPSRRLNPVQLAAKQQVDHKVSSQYYAFVATPCPVCSNTSFETLAEKDRYGLRLHVVICTTCGLVQSNPRMTQAAYTEFYNVEYRQLYGGSSEPTEGFFRRQYESGRRIHAFLKNHNLLPTPRGYILDVGCGAGGTTAYFQDQGYRVVGVDIGEEYLMYGVKQGLDLRQGTIHDLLVPSRPDLVLYADVLEHILEPASELVALHRLSPGSVYIGMPSIKILSHLNKYRMDFLQLLQNAHVWHFTLRSLTNLMAVNRFQLIVGTEMIQSVFQPVDVTKQWVTDYEAILKYLQQLERLRLLYPFRRLIMEPTRLAVRVINKTATIFKSTRS